MTPQKTFGERLRELRIAADKSMGQVAREIGVTTVYYSQVENEKVNPFPRGKVDFDRLARAVNGDADELMRLAIVERGSFEFGLQTSDRNVQEVAVMLARRLSDDSLTRRQIADIKKILEGG